jgi:hypothetical protein
VASTTSGWLSVKAVVSVNAAMPQAVKASVLTPVRRYFGDGRDFDLVVSNLCRSTAARSTSMDDGAE